MHLHRHFQTASAALHSNQALPAPPEPLTCISMLQRPNSPLIKGAPPLLANLPAKASAPSQHLQHRSTTPAAPLTSCTLQ
jgi:hypothetical protein